MYRTLSMYPKSINQAHLDDLVERMVAYFRTSRGFRGASTSVGALMGPGAVSGEYGRIFAVDFDTIDDALDALQAEDFRAMEEAAEAFAAAQFMYESRELP